MCRKYESLTHGFNDDAPVRQAPEEEPYIEDKTKIHGFNDDAPAYTEGLAAAAGSAAAYDLSYDPSDDELNFDPDSYVPDDFEPDLDPYDRQALYDEEVVDDWVIAGGGDPFDFDDRMDAFADPFGFGGDGDPVD